MYGLRIGRKIFGVEWNIEPRVEKVPWSHAVTTPAEELPTSFIVVLGQFLANLHDSRAAQTGPLDIMYWLCKPFKLNEIWGWYILQIVTYSEQRIRPHAPQLNVSIWSMTFLDNLKIQVGHCCPHLLSFDPLRSAETTFHRRDYVHGSSPIPIRFPSFPYLSVTALNAARRRM